MLRRSTNRRDKIRRRKVTLWLYGSAIDALDQIGQETGKSHTDIINECLVLSARRDTMVKKFVNDAIEEQTSAIGELVRQIVKEELSNK